MKEREIELGQQAATAIPPSVTEAHAASKAKTRSEVEVDQPKDCWRRKPIRIQLLVAYGSLSLIAFGTLLGVSAYITSSTADSAISISREELRDQIVNNSKLMLEDTSLVLDARLHDGFSVLVQPVVFALFDSLGGDSRLLPISSYAETTRNHLKPPLVYDNRYQCTGDATGDAFPTTGCNSQGVGGAQNTGLQQISKAASSVYVVGSSIEGTGFGPATDRTWEEINRTSVADHLWVEAYERRQAWVDAFVAIDCGPSPPIYRHFPGAVGSRAVSSGNARSYDPTGRPWYTSTLSASQPPAIGTWAYREHLPMSLTEPYLDAFGRGYMITISTPVAGPNGVEVGVAGAEILVSSLQDIITTIRSRETGEAHFLYKATGAVVASRQLPTNSRDITFIPLIDSLTLPGSNDCTGRPCKFSDLADTNGGTATPHGLLTNDPELARSSSGSMYKWANGEQYQLVWQEMWSGRFLMLTCTRMDEITAPIETQVSKIRSQSAAIYAFVIVICGSCLGLMIIMCSILSFKLSAPVKSTVKQSNQIVSNIGGDLFEGIKTQGRREGEKPTWSQGESALAGILVQTPGEVAALRGEFLKMLFMLNRKRVRGTQPKSPFRGQQGNSAPPSAQQMLHEGTTALDSSTDYTKVSWGLERTESTKEREERLLQPPIRPKVTRWNKIVSKIFFMLLLPTMISMLVIVTVTFSMVQTDLISWLRPVKQTMVNEELVSLQIRTYERAQYAASVIDTAAGSLEVLHGFATKLVNNEIPHGEPRTINFSPRNACPSSSILSSNGVSDLFNCNMLERQLGPRPAYNNNFSAPVHYKPRSPNPTIKSNTLSSAMCCSNPATLEVPDATTSRNVAAMSDPYIKQELLTSQLDAALSAIFFASNVTYTYVAIHSTETYIQFPYQDLGAYTRAPSAAAGPRQCDACTRGLPCTSTTITDYTPICRPWYYAAATLTNDYLYGSIKYNEVLNNANAPGTMFLSLSKRLTNSAGELVGVVAADVDLVGLADKIGSYPSCSFLDESDEWACPHNGVLARAGGASAPGSKLYNRGYTMIWDENGMGVVHKNYGKEQNLNLGPLPVARLDAGSDTSFMEQFQANVVDKGRVSGNWSWPWFSSACECEEIWHYSFMPVPNSPYMIALTVVEPEVTAVADRAQARMLARVIAGRWGSIAVCAGVLFVLFAFTWWLNRRFSLPLLRLLKLMRKWSDGQFENSYGKEQWADDAKQSANLELSILMSNFKKMLIALRFGDDKWAKGGDGQSDMMRNNFAALELVQGTGNPEKGLGVVLNNIALLSNMTMDDFPLLKPMEIYAAAVESAKAGVQATMHLPSLDPASQAAADTLALRLLNFALFYMRVEPPNMHVASNLLLEVSLRCGHNARTMATVAKYISLETAETKDVNILAALDGIITAGLKQLAANPLDFANTDILADLAVAHCDVGCNAIVPGSAQPTQFTKPENLAMWTLFNVATISPTTRTRLCLHAKAGSRDPALIHFIDSVGELGEANPKACGEIPAGEATKMWRDMSGGITKPKAMMMVLDLSYSMDSGERGEKSRLNQCKDSLLTILADHIDEKDKAGLVTFADDVKEEFPLMIAGPPTSDARTKMVANVYGMRTRGMTAFYSAVEFGASLLAQQLAAEPDTPKWLVALTDGADNKSKPGAVDRGVQILRSTPKLNLALITVGGEMDMRACVKYMDAVEAAGNTSLLVKAKNQVEIAAAFETVSAAMSAGVKEVL